MNNQNELKINNGININVIPKPFSVNINDGFFEIDNSASSQIKILTNNDPKLISIAEYFENLLNSSSVINFKILIQEIATQSSTIDANNVENIAIILGIDPDQEEIKGKEEGYILLIDSRNIQIIGHDHAGVFYGIQTLRQLLPPEIEIKNENSNNTYNNSTVATQMNLVQIKIPCCKIVDYPRFKWRGFMLDVCRHFFGTETIKKFLDMMALQKLNIFHWHLTEDQGWRTEIKKYPKLTEIGAWRKNTQLKNTRSKKFTNKPHGGFYTQEEIKEIIDYAKKRFITIVPEIEIPGHSQAAIAAYPNLTCFGDNFEVATTFGVKKIVYCPGKDHVFEFWKDVLREIMQLFPSKVIHTGGDEVPKDRWKKCPDCQKRICDLNLKDEEALQVYVTNTMATFLAKNGRRLMGWNEILDKDLEMNAICHYWAHSEQKVVDHINKGRDTVVSKNQFTYLNHSYYFLPISNVYSLDPILNGVNPDKIKHILGVEYPLWTEWIPDQNKLEWQAFPRLLAGAEVAWTMLKNKNFDDFIQRLKSFIKRLDYLKINYAKIKEINPSLIQKIKNTLKNIFN
ncbi:MAG: beta-N-acetylhexosaminidase [Promethearchaeota archaeon]